MFGLNEISYTQFITGILLCLFTYYLLVLIYLALKSKMEAGKEGFEYEASHTAQDITAKHVSSQSLPAKRVYLSENTTESFLVKPDLGIDISGLPLETFTRPTRMEASRFEKELAFATQQTIHS